MRLFILMGSLFLSTSLLAATCPSPDSFSNLNAKPKTFAADGVTWTAFYQAHFDPNSPLSLTQVAYNYMGTTIDCIYKQTVNIKIGSSYNQVTIKTLALITKAKAKPIEGNWRKADGGGQSCTQDCIFEFEK